MNSPKKKNIKPRTARIIVLVIFLSGIVLGITDTPDLGVKLLSKLGLSKFEGKMENILLHFPYRFGLDIQGGTHLVYQANLQDTDSSMRADSMESVRDVIERRVNLFGVTEPLVQIEKAGEDWRLIVELAGIKDINAAIRIIGETPFLEFKEERSSKEQEAILKEQEGKEIITEDPYFRQTGLTGKYVKRASLEFGQTTFEPIVNLELTEEGGVIFEELTKRNVGKRLAIYLDGAPISAPVVREEISGGRAQISGNFTPEEGRELVGRLNAGALPVPIALIGQQSIGASLGEESLAKSLYAGIIGFLAVAIFMILWYRLPGLLSVIALIFYVFVVLAIFKLIPVTLTVAGIAGLILSIGMAVDANILIFERLKEELRKGKGLEEAIQEGFGRAWTSIRDSNVSSLITCGILYWVGTSIVQGFALTLSIGIFVSMISAIWVTRTLLVATTAKFMQNKRIIFMGGISR